MNRICVCFFVLDISVKCKWCGISQSQSSGPCVVLIELHKLGHMVKVGLLWQVVFVRRVVALLYAIVLDQILVSYWYRIFAGHCLARPDQKRAVVGALAEVLLCIDLAESLEVPSGKHRAKEREREKSFFLAGGGGGWRKISLIIILKYPSPRSRIGWDFKFSTWERQLAPFSCQLTWYSV